MSTLTKKEIINLIKEEKIIFSPQLDQFQIQPNSVDLRVGWNFYIPKTWEYNDKGRIALNLNYLDFNEKKDNYKIIRLKEGQYFEILPEEFVIISTLEKISFKSGDVMATLLARSSVVRRGLAIESGSIDSRYEGFLMLPVKNNTNQVIRIYPGERICQLIFSQLSSMLSEEEATIHGVFRAKYLESTPYGLEARSDGEDEISLIKKGKIENLKKIFKISKINFKNVEKVKYPYIPKGKEILYIGEDNVFMQEAKKILDKSGCVKHPTAAVVVKEEKIIGRGSNSGKKVLECPRWDSKTGTNYGPCKEICEQDGHSEVTSINDAIKNGEETRGADLYLYGHWWCCENCWNKITESEIRNVYLLENSENLFNPEINEKMKEWGKPAGLK
jgi:dCTP deaminase